INGVLSTYTDNRGVQLRYPVPVLTSAVFDASGTLLEGSVTGAPFSYSELDVFVSPDVDASGFGEGQTYLETVSIFIDETGTGLFRIRLDESVPIGQWITATVTDSDKNTSQFSQAIPVAALAGGNPSATPQVPQNTGAGEIAFSAAAVTI